MTAASHSPLVRCVADALKAAYGSVKPYTRMIDRWASMAEAALNACHAEETRKLLEEAAARLRASEYVRDNNLADKIEDLLAKLESGV